ncbi:MAG: permease-like cell division protein FtsX [Patescibacteria group bacterium]
MKNLFDKSFKLALSNIWRNKLLSLATIFVTGTIIFIFNIILAVNFIAQDALSNLNKKIDITVYLKETTTEEQALQITNDLKNIKEVAQVTYTSKKDALVQIKKTHPDITLAFEKYDLGNPLPASINIVTIDPKYHQEISKYLAQDKYKLYLSNVISTNDESNSIITSVSKNLVKLTDFTQQIIFWVVVIFIIGGALIILNALQITIFNRKQEISVMKLVGASHWFIRSPFLIESIIYGVLAVISSFVMLFLLSQKIKIDEMSLWNYYDSLNFATIFAVEILATLALSILSSLIAINGYLKKDLHET